AAPQRPNTITARPPGRTLPLMHSPRSLDAILGPLARDRYGAPWYDALGCALSLAAAHAPSTPYPMSSFTAQTHSACKAVSIPMVGASAGTKTACRVWSAVSLLPTATQISRSCRSL